MGSRNNGQSPQFHHLIVTSDTVIVGSPYPLHLICLAFFLSITTSISKNVNAGVMIYCSNVTVCKV